jgi:putative hemolysin
MSTTVLIEIILIFVLILANGVFAMAEIAVVSSRKARLLRSAQKGNRRAVIALDLANNPDAFLSTVQVGITTIGVLAGAVGGVTIAAQIDAAFERIPALQPWSEAIGVGVVVLAITYLSVVLGELAPKRIALNHPERIAMALAPSMHALSRFASPLVAVLGGSSRVILWLLRIPRLPHAPVTEEELRILLRQGALAGTIEKHEGEIVERVFRLGDRPARAIMTPRTEVEWVDITWPLAELQDVVRASSHSLFPVIDALPNRVIGVLHAKHFFEATDADDLRSRIEPVVTVSETLRGLELLERFRETRARMAVVVDEFAAVEGIATPQDILEGLVGELPEAGVEYEPPIVVRADGSWSVDAFVDMEELKSVTGAQAFSGQKDGVYQTVAGWAIERLGHIPKIGESFEASGYRFEIADMDGRRVDRILVSRLSEQPSS